MPWRFLACVNPGRLVSVGSAPQGLKKTADATLPRAKVDPVRGRQPVEQAQGRPGLSFQGTSKLCCLMLGYGPGSG